MKRAFYILMLVAVMAGCGKNESFYPIGQAPPPNYYQPPPAGQPGFTPQLPPGYPPQYTPFLPIDYYMRQDPYRQQYWGQFWQGWTQYAGYNGYQPYDFNRFWYEYCPQQWQGSQYQSLYLYFDYNFYGWNSPGTQFPQQMDPYYFWQNYDGYYYQDPYSCGYGCY